MFFCKTIVVFITSQNFFGNNYFLKLFHAESVFSRLHLSEAPPVCRTRYRRARCTSGLARPATTSRRGRDRWRRGAPTSRSHSSRPTGATCSAPTRSLSETSGCWRCRPCCRCRCHCAAPGPADRSRGYGGCRGQPSPPPGC